jgi:hypothetical protein
MSVVIHDLEIKQHCYRRMLAKNQGLHRLYTQFSGYHAEVVDHNVTAEKLHSNHRKNTDPQPQYE